MNLTKKQFDNLATKVDLNKLAKKSDLKFKKVDENFKKVDEKFKKVDERFSEVNKRLDKLDVEVVGIREDMKNMIRRDEFNERMDVIIGYLEDKATKNKDHEIEHISNIAAHDRFEKRISKLEKQPITRK